MTKNSIPAVFLAKLREARKTIGFNAMKIVKTGKAESAQMAAQMLDEYEAIVTVGDRPEATEPADTLMFEPHGQCSVTIRKTEQHRHEGTRNERDERGHWTEFSHNLERLQTRANAKES